MNAYRNQYQQNQILTASPEQILLMLYDGAIRYCKQAVLAKENEETVLKLEKISKTYAIISEFSDSLNHDIGGEIAADLDGLYHFMLRELNLGRTDSETTHLKTVEKLLLDLRQTWAEAVEINKREQALLYKKNIDVEHTINSSERHVSAAG